MHTKTQKIHNPLHVRSKSTGASAQYGFQFKKKLPTANQTKQFTKKYALPLSVTVLFLIVLIGVLVLRAQERLALVELLPSISEVSEDYSSLISGDKSDEFKKNDDNKDTPTANQSRTTNPAGSPSSFAINTSGTTGGTGSATPSSGGGTTVQPFASSITSFQQASVALECTGGKQNKGSCSKRYTFNAGVRTVNGPGAVSYSWRSSLQSANSDSSFSAASGTATTSLQKQIVLACISSASYTLQLVLTNPSAVQSAVLTLNHNCNDI